MKLHQEVYFEEVEVILQYKAYQLQKQLKSISVPFNLL